MSTLELQFAALLILFSFLRPVLLRPCAVRFSARTTPAFITMWVMLGIVVMLPWCYPELVAAAPTLVENPLVVVVALIKGVGLWLCIYLEQELRRVSMSSSVFVRPASLGIIALVNAALGEQLNVWQWTATTALTLLGFLFMLKGHFITLTLRQKAFYVIVLLLSVVPLTADQYVLSQINWFTHLVLYTLGMFAMSFAMRTTRAEWMQGVPNNSAIYAGVVWVVSEVFTLYAMSHVLPVSVAGLCMTLPIPFIMVMSALRWHEQSWKTQAFFGALALAASLPMFFMATP
jgi:hypothetical protein